MMPNRGQNSEITGSAILAISFDKNPYEIPVENSCRKVTSFAGSAIPPGDDLELVVRPSFTRLIAGVSYQLIPFLT